MPLAQVNCINIFGTRDVQACACACVHIYIYVDHLLKIKNNNVKRIGHLYILISLCLVCSFTI